jgi:hypothetical protein
MFSVFDFIRGKFSAKKNASEKKLGALKFVGQLRIPAKP